jgi:hypothetical protein
MHYLVPYSRIAPSLGDDGTGQKRDISINYDTLVDIIRHVCAAVPVDEAWYCKTYKTVGDALAAGAFGGSALYHYAAAGYFEGRRPFDLSAAPLPAAFKDIMGLVEVIPSRGTLMARSSTDRLRTLLKLLLSAIPVDSAWYLKTYPEVRASLAAGAVANAAEHFVHLGYFKDYWPYDMKFDEAWYLGKYTDLKAALAKNLIGSAHEHFRVSGYQECRLPYGNIPLM